MAAGVPSGWTLEVKFDGTNWVDITSSCERIGITQRGRPSEYDDASAAILTAELLNPAGSFTPDNPLSPYYPHVVEDVSVRLTVTRAAVSYVRFLGTATNWEPDGVSAADATVTLSAVDPLGPAASAPPLYSEWCEQCLINAADGIDVWSPDGASARAAVGGASTLRNIGTLPSGVSQLGTATVIPSATGWGDVAIGSADGVALDGAITLTSSSTIGPVIRLVPSKLGLLQMAMWIRVDVGFRPPSGLTSYVVQAWANGNELFTLRLLNNLDVATDLWLYDGTPAQVGRLQPGVDDGQWHLLLFQQSQTTPTSTSVWCDPERAVAWTTAADIRTVTRVYVGGFTNPSAEGKAANCSTVTLGAIELDRGLGVIQRDFAKPGSVTRFAGGRVTSGFALYAAASLPGGITITGSDNRLVVRSDITGRTALDCLQELARTVGGLIWARPDGVIEFRQPDVMRPSAVSVTLDAEADLEAGNGLAWKRSIDSAPTQVTVTTPVGEVLVSGSGTSRARSIQACSATLADAASVASGMMNYSRRLRPPALAIELTTAANDLYSAVMTMAVGSRIRLTNIPQALLGWTYVDLFALGWSEEYTRESVKFTIDCTPADPDDGIWDTNRWAWGTGIATVTGGTCVGNTGTGTVIATWTDGSPISTSAGDYPCDLNWNGERITIGSAPAGSTSPQTLTVTARGVAPSIARSHSTGEPVDAWDASWWAI